MRMHIELDDDIMARVDEVAGPRGRSRFVREAIVAALDLAERWELIHSARGVISDEVHDWDDDAAAWVHAQRFADERRTG